MSRLERLPPFHFVHVPPRCPIVRSVWRFSALSLFMADDAAFACLVQCSARIAHLAVRNGTSAGNVWHTQRDFSVLSLPSGKLIGKLHFLPPNVPTPPARVSRGRAQQSMRKERKIHGLSYPKRIGRRFVFLDFTIRCRRGTDATVFSAVDAKRQDSFYFRRGGDHSPLDVYDIAL